MSTATESRRSSPASIERVAELRKAIKRLRVADVLHYKHFSSPTAIRADAAAEKYEAEMAVERLLCELGQP